MIAMLSSLTYNIAVRSNMKSLNPTLWRTCKMLAGRKRVQLLRQLHDHPGSNVSELGDAVGIKRACASQELRRIQSRGLLKSQRQGRSLIYRLDPDPQVSSAAPLLKAIQTALHTLPARQDMDMCRLANGLAHPRRIAIVQALLESPQSTPALQLSLRMPTPSLLSHLHVLEQSGMIIRRHPDWVLSCPLHPLARTLIHLLRKSM